MAQRKLWLLLRPRERWRSIVMSTSVCLCLCQSVREYISRTTRDLYRRRRGWWRLLVVVVIRRRLDERRNRLFGVLYGKS